MVRNSAQLHELHQDKQFTPLIIFYRNSTSQLSQMSFGPNSIAVEFRFRRRLWPALLHVFLLPSALLVLVCAALWLPIAQTTANLLPASRVYTRTAVFQSVTTTVLFEPLDLLTSLKLCFLIAFSKLPFKYHHYIFKYSTSTVKFFAYKEILN